ncbi:putative 8-amino-7-oxononanoate synthase 2 [Aspergillus udagawae]|nr:putative 8-amino-7-oxononanoate synthase 2 [Aspergillus udagawae]
MAVSTIYNAQNTTEEDSPVAPATSPPAPARRAARRCTRSRTWSWLTRSSPSRPLPLHSTPRPRLLTPRFQSSKLLSTKVPARVFRGIHLSAPPFPFRQRWDANARHEIGERKNRGTKRKRREYEEYDDEEDYEYFDNEKLQRVHDLMAATLVTIAAMDTCVHPTKRRKKATKKRKQGRAAAGDDVAGPAGSS